MMGDQNDKTAKILWSFMDGFWWRGMTPMSSVGAVPPGSVSRPPMPAIPHRLPDFGSLSVAAPGGRTVPVRRPERGHSLGSTFPRTR